jgi:Mg-chelatase subunit ChlD
VAILITAASLVFLVPVVGLAIDAGILYAVKGKLSAASDAAALAAARSLSRGMTLAEQEDSAKARATAFFHANFPSGAWNTSSKTVSIDVTETGFRTRTVTVTSRVEATTLFMRVFGHDKLPVATSSTASRRDVNMVMVLDRSGSMSTSGACTPMKDAARTFVASFANGRDRLAMITFGASTFLGYAPNMNFKSTSPTLDAQIAAVNCGGATSSAMALWEAYQQLVAINEPGALNILLFFTDGLPNGVTALYPIKTATDTRFGTGSSPYSSTSTLYSMPPSTCQDEAGRTHPHALWAPQARLGVLAQAGGGSTGSTWGLYALTASGIGSTTEVSISGALGSSADRSGCNFGPGTSNLTRVRMDVAYMPTADQYGNRTDCCYKTVETVPSGPYAGQIRIDRPTAISRASANAADNAAARIRSDAWLNPVIYTIGLGDPESSEPPDDVFMRRASNDPLSPIYDPAKQTGLYVFAPDKSHLGAAFAKIASEILRIAF